jgi:hypothetical protein
MTDSQIETMLHYIDVEDESDYETINYESLIEIITELHNRIEQLEKWQDQAQSSAKSVREHIDL